MPNHDEIVTLAEAVADYARELHRNNVPLDQMTPLLLSFQEQLVWHDLLGHCEPLPREPWEEEGDS